MCHRISPLVIAELREALRHLQESGHARVPKRDPATPVPDVYPGRQLPLFTLGTDGQLEATELTWGFEAPPGATSKLVFNTRIETALAQARAGRGLWARPLALGRCLVPVYAFFESWTRNPPQRGAQVRFTLPGHRVFLLAGVQEAGRVSVVTTEPNDSVSSLHSRMPLVLAPGESALWLGPDFAQLANRSSIRLDALPELPSSPASATGQLPL